METKLRTADDCPPEAREMLEGVQKRMGGLLPNLYKQMANNPPILQAYLDLQKLFSKSGFSAAEQQLILLTASARNGCRYCVAAHSSGGRMAGLDKEVINAVRDGTVVPDGRLQALRVHTEAVLESRGKVNDAALAAFLSAGFTEDHAREIILGVSMKALSNSFARFAETPLDGFLEKMKWDGNERV
ncbi:MAG: carboxymuconolactone decarboxylase family protein [Rhizobiaceae bacterium]